MAGGRNHLRYPHDKNLQSPSSPIRKISGRSPTFLRNLGHVPISTPPVQLAKTGNEPSALQSKLAAMIKELKPMLRLTMIPQSTPGVCNRQLQR